jgi:hypothetical protein
MAHQQKQAFCHNCRVLRLHTRETREVPHLFHLVMSCLCCGTWLFVWFLHIFVDALSSQPDFLCSSCGQAEGIMKEAPPKAKKPLREIGDDWKYELESEWEKEERKKGRKERLVALGEFLEAFLISPLVEFFGFFVSVKDDWPKVDERPWTVLLKTLGCILIPVFVLVGLYIFFRTVFGS